MLSSLDHLFRLRAFTVRTFRGSYYISDEDHPEEVGT